MNRPAIFFDLDGPLLDVRARYHGVYADIASRLGITPLCLEAYWSAKRARRPLGTFFPGFADQRALREIYLDRWLAQIEAPEWLDRDTVADGALECLEQLSSTHTLVLVTLRRNQVGLKHQLQSTGLARYFTAVRSGWAADRAVATASSNPGTNGETDAGARLKAAWIREFSRGGREVLIADTEIDMQAARLAGIRAIGVSFGIREAADLLRWGAEVVIDHPAELLELMGAGW